MLRSIELIKNARNYINDIVDREKELLDLMNKDDHECLGIFRGRVIGLKQAIKIIDEAIDLIPDEEFKMKNHDEIKTILNVAKSKITDAKTKAMYNYYKGIIEILEYLIGKRPNPLEGDYHE